MYFSNLLHIIPGSLGKVVTLGELLSFSWFVLDWIRWLGDAVEKRVAVIHNHSVSMCLKRVVQLTGWSMPLQCVQFMRR